MTPAKSGDQDVGAGEVFVEITEKTQFPGFRFFRWGGIWRLAEAREGPRRKTALRRIKNWGV